MIFNHFFLFFFPEIPEHHQTVTELGPSGSNLQTLLGAVEKTVSSDGRKGFHAEAPGHQGLHAFHQAGKARSTSRDCVQHQPHITGPLIVVLQRGCQFATPTALYRPPPVPLQQPYRARPETMERCRTQE